MVGRSNRDSSILPSLYCKEEHWQRCSPQEASNEETASYQINSDGFAAYVQPSISHCHASFAVNVAPIAPRLASARSTHLVGVKGINFEDRGQRPQAVQVVWLSRSPIELVPVSCAPYDTRVGVNELRFLKFRLMLECSLESISLG